ncbi:MAG: SufD family Fe-S cluster assembly protein [Candidatus Andeanibacterium colombiense]|uniref:SufD family Fe-S cluster assembly protein n=1 Tax=Candidatus Andeanibacterium colombiense TaxID=3121345 RepID=A0AAJ5X2T3_9SPHN|nr:MAG: SufD family Fe-S cluster assembly protein [Sphingomonadaceae bacterium]
MTELATLPTTRDENWRYADPAALEALVPENLDVWHEVTLAAGETRSKTLILDEAHPGIHRVRMVLGEGARAEIYAIVSASAYTRLEIEVRLGKAAHFEFGGVTIGGGDATREFVTRVEHAEPEATSNQTVRAVHWGRATGNFLGRLEVARDAQKTDAAQNFRAMLLEKGASANAKPELEIFADDVKCAHGAAIGALDQTAAFYMAARGIPPEAARKLLIRAFVADAFHALGDADERDALLEEALAVLGEEVA